MRDFKVLHPVANAAHNRGKILLLYERMDPLDDGTSRCSNVTHRQFFGNEIIIQLKFGRLRF
jgi:hypothetical protein